MANESLKHKILIVEDDVAIMQVLAKRLEREGFEVSQAVDGIEGLDKAMKERPDLILLDIIMPRMDGFSVLKQLREDSGWGSKVQVMLLTNLGQEEDVSLGKEYGAIDYLVKSDWKIGDVVKKVKTKLVGN